MPERRKKAAASGDDRLSTLPDALLLHTLSLLPSDEAVRTCVLARRWRNLWRYIPSLRLIQDSGFLSSAGQFNKFVSHLIVLRDRSPLVNCEILLDPDYPNDGRRPCQYVQAVQLWIQYALACQNVSLQCSMDFSRCLVLENLEMKYCNIDMHKISSKSLKRLCITWCFFPTHLRTRISVPGLISLQLDDCDFRTPLLESMPLLESAFIRLDEKCEDVCENSYNWNCDQESCNGCYGFGDYQGVLLNGLSNAISLELIAEPYNYIFRRDVARCPIFGRLKTLVLSEWCAAVDMYSLVRVLQRSPILEKLALKIHNNMDTDSAIGVEGNHVPAELSFVCTQLKVANIECQELDGKIHKIWNILRTCGVHPEKISIKIKHTGFYHPLLCSEPYALFHCFPWTGSFG